MSIISSPLCAKFLKVGYPSKIFSMTSDKSEFQLLETMCLFTKGVKKTLFLTEFETSLSKVADKSSWVHKFDCVALQLYNVLLLTD